MTRRGIPRIGKTQEFQCKAVKCNIKGPLNDIEDNYCYKSIAK